MKCKTFVSSYYQEIGRAGRDGEPAEAVLFYRTEDLGLRRFFAGGGRRRGAAGIQPVTRRDDARLRRADHCRRAFILSYLGEEAAEECGNCDNCETGRGRAELGERPFEVGAAVRHGEWGDGVVQRYDGDQLAILFQEAGYKTLSVELVVERDLLETVS